MISSRPRLLYSNALGVKKFRYMALKNMPPEVIKDGVYHICVEGLLEAQQKRERLNPEALFMHMSAYGCTVQQRVPGSVREGSCEHNQWSDHQPEES